MRRIASAVAAALCMSIVAAAEPPPPEGTPSVTDPSIPLTYVGGDGSVSIGINDHGDSEGQLVGVFARNNTRALVGQLWWDRTGAGGVQSDFNWLWGMDPVRARNEPDSVTISRLSFALDQNAEHDRKATIGFGIERREFSVEAYLARGVSSGRPAGSSVRAEQATINGSDPIGSYQEIETTAVETVFESKPYGSEIGLQFSHVFEPMALRVHGGASVQNGDGAHANTFSAGLDTPLGTRGWGMSALAEHVNRSGGVDGNGSDDRISVYLRYEFGRNGAFTPTSQLEDPAWISRSLARPSTAHPRIVETHRVQRSQNVSVTRGPRQYTNRFPLLRDDSANVPGGQASSIDVLANDSDPDGDALTLSALTAPAHGSAVIAGGRILYTPASGFVGSDALRYTVVDARGGSASAGVVINVGTGSNAPPIAQPDNANTTFGQPVTIAPLANDSDADGDALSLLGVDQPLHGTVVVSGNTLVYTPEAGFSGVDRFTYTISDGRGGSAHATITVTVGALANRPPLALNDTATTTAPQTVTIDVLANDSDPDGDTLALAATSAPSSGTAAVSGNVVLYTPAAGFVGIDRFNYSISDGRGGIATATVTVTVAAIPNRPPVAVDDAATTSFAQPVTIAVLGNDSDPDGDPLTITAVTAPLAGTAVVSGNTIIYTPGAAGAPANDRFTYTISDGRGGVATATVNVTVTAVADLPPVAVDDTANTASGAPVTIAVLNNDSDPDGDPLTITAVGAPLSGTAVIAGNAIVYTPAAGIAGIDRFSYTISDGRGGTASAFVTVVIATTPNQPPVAANDAALTPANTPVTIAVLANDTDPEGDPLTITGVTQPANGSTVFGPNGVTYTPNPGFLGFDQFNYTISDGHGGTATAAVAVFVNG
jgi:hypothetical protein